MFKKVIVLEVISDSFFYTDDNIQDLMNYYGVKNSYYLNKNIPPNTIIAIDANKKTSDAKLYFPFFSHTQKPIKVGEWAWALEDWEYAKYETNMNYSYWLSRVVGPTSSEDSNYTHNDKNSNNLGTEDLNHLLNGNQYYSLNDDDKKYDFDKSLILNLYENNEYEELIKNSISENFQQKEAIPKVIARPGEHLLEGSNNSYILLGVDRTTSKVNAILDDTENISFFKKKPGTKNGKISLTSNISEEDLNPKSKKILTFKKINEENTGCVDIVAGKIQKENFNIIDLKSSDGKNTLWKERDKRLSQDFDKESYFKNVDIPNFADDKCRIFLSQKTNLSENFNITFDPDIQSTFSSIAIKSDIILNVSRKKINLIFQENFYSTEDDCSYLFLNKEFNVKSAKGSNITISNQKSKFEIKNNDINLNVNNGNKIRIGNDNIELINTIYNTIKLLVDNASSLTLSSIGPTTLNPTVLTQLQKILNDIKNIGDI